MEIWVGKNGTLQWRDVDNNKPKTKKYKVRVFTSAIEFWEVEAENEQEAMDNYWEGENYFTKPKGEDIEILEEVK